MGADRPRLWLTPLAGLIAFGAWQLQPLIALLGTAVRSTDLLSFTILRAPIELYVLARTVLSPRPSVAEAEAKRPEYEALISPGLARFYEPRRETCPVCESKS